jgi:hypothetical protein
MSQRCAICDCTLHRTAGTYARRTVEGRSHATQHHFVAERFFGRSSNQKGTKPDAIFDSCPWGHERETAVLCHECREDLLKNPVLLPDDIALFADLVEKHGYAEEEKSTDRSKLGGRVQLLHEVLRRGLASLAQEPLGSS